MLDLDGVQDPDTVAALDRLAAAGIDVLPKLGSTDFGLPNVYVVGAAADDDVLRATAGGEAVHPDREVALRKAVLEFASARARRAFMHGPVADVAAIAPPGYLDWVVASMDPSGEEPRVLDAMAQWLRLHAEAWRPRVEATMLRRTRRVPFTSLPTTTRSNGRSVLDDVHGRLADAGFDVLVAVLTEGMASSTGDMLAVKVVVPGMEVETVTVITVTVNLLAGYAFAKLPFRGRSVLFLLLLSTMMIPIQAIMVPQFELVIDLGLYGTIWAVVLPTSAAVFGIFLARQFFLALPDELMEAARVDGAGQLRTFLQIVLPLSKPLIAVLVLLTFMAEWNDFAWPLIVFFSDNTLFTLPVGLVTDLKGQYATNYGALMAMTIVMVLPIVVLFLAFQRYFVAGLARSGIK